MLVFEAEVEGTYSFMIKLKDKVKLPAEIYVIYNGNWNRTISRRLNYFILKMKVGDRVGVSNNADMENATKVDLGLPIVGYFPTLAPITNWENLTASHFDPIEGGYLTPIFPVMATGPFNYTMRYAASPTRFNFHRSP